MDLFWASRLQQNRFLFAFCCCCKFDLFTFFLNVIFFCLLGQILEKYIWKCKMFNFFLSGNLIFVLINLFRILVKRLIIVFSFNRYDVSLLSFYVGEVEAE